MTPKKAALELTLKSIFAIFIVIFVLFVIFSVFSSRTSFLQQKSSFDYESAAQNFFLTVLSSPCLSIGEENKTLQVTTQALISEHKIRYLANNNQDLRCAQSALFLYTLDMEDLENGKRWRIGIKEEPDFMESKTVSLPASIVYEPKIIHQGSASLTIYSGSLSMFYGAIKQVCFSKKQTSYEVESDYKITYDNNKNILTSGSFSFFPAFSCKVESFSIDSGNHLVYIAYQDNKVVLKK